MNIFFNCIALKMFHLRKFILTERECPVSFNCDSHENLFNPEEPTAESLIDAAHRMVEDIQNQCSDEDFAMFYLTLEGKYEDHFQRL